MDDREKVKTALDAIDDAVALVDDRPVPVDALWHEVLQSLIDGPHDSLAIVHPSWWSSARIKVIAGAAAGLADHVVMRRRSELLAQAAPSQPKRAVVEIVDDFVVVSGAVVAAERRDGEQCRVAEKVARTVMRMTGDTAGTVLIDAPTTISGAAALAALIAGQLRVVDADLTVIVIKDAELCRIAAETFSADEAMVPEPAETVTASRYTTFSLIVIAVIAFVALAAVPGVSTVGRRAVRPAEAMPTTFLVEGRVALTAPAQWATRRVVAGPGSARVQVISPTDPEVALHVTQSLVADQTLSDTANVLRRAIDGEQAGVFVDFNPAGRSAGRPAVTYREVRAGHDIRWSVLLDGAVRISIGCQSPPGAEAAVREVCELAVRSAHALR